MTQYRLEKGRMTVQASQSKTLLLFFLTLGVFLVLRLWNLPNFLYFIYDQGRDAAKLAEIASGQVTLIGPTTGLEGLFLGPLWYYVGVPGFILSGGSPVGIAAWFILLSAVAFPFFWWLNKVLFWQQPKGNKKEPTSQRQLSVLFGWLCLVLFVILPGSIVSSTTIWNPLLAAPLMSAALYSFWRVRAATQKWLWLANGFFCLALTLQSEFAYAVFYLPVLFLAIPWMTKRIKWTDFVTAGMAVGVTLVPQLLFELRHQFIMTNSLLRSLGDPSKTVSWSRQLAQRPIQLFGVTMDFFLAGKENVWAQVAVLGVIAIGVAATLWFSWQLRKLRTGTAQVSARLYLKQLLCLFAIIPYPFYLFWRGNDGNFFSYYITPHFVFLVPLFVLGLEYLTMRLWALRWGKLVAGVGVTVLLLPVVMSSVSHWVGTIYAPVNRAGLRAMETAVETAYSLAAPQRSATLILTPNVYSVHYDYLFQRYADQAMKYDQDYVIRPPRTVPQPDDTQLILVIEQWGPQMSDYVKEQRRHLTAGMQRQRVVLSGMITVEEWVKEPAP